jgi:UPF0755 protein
MRRYRLQALLGLLGLLVSLIIGVFWADYRAFRQTPLTFPEAGWVYMLRTGDNTGSLGRELTTRGALHRPILYLRCLAWEQGAVQRLKAGEYRIPTGITPLNLLALLTSGRVMQHPFTLVEGWNFAQARQALSGLDWVRHTLENLTPEEIMVRLGRPGTAPEGHFLPDTYYFPRGTPDVDVLRRALQGMDRLLATAWAKRTANLPLETPEQALILASIIEKESAIAAERPQIAGVFLRRLRLGMRLQTDPTVIYGLGARFTGKLHHADLGQDTPYNTYMHKGLPPTPIALPGREAILAALHPQWSDALYFVARGDGSHIFSTTLEAHNRAVHQHPLNEVNK